MSTGCFCLVTGASSGIGRELAIALSQDGPLILNGRNSERLEETRQSCKNPARHLLWPQELADVEAVGESLQQFIVCHSVKISQFVHCAGTLDVLPIRSITLDHLVNVMSVNFISAAVITTGLIKKKLNGQNLKSIVFISSIASEFGAKGFSAYSASKGALDSYMRSIAVELAPKVRVNSVLPGGIHTKMTQKIYEDGEVGARLMQDYPLGVGEASDIVAAVKFLLSDDARWITGQQLVVDGGRSVNISA